MCGYNPTFNFGTCVVYNSAGGMNCSSQDAYTLSARAGNIVSCMAYSALLQLHGGPWLDCLRYPWAAAHDLEKAKAAAAGHGGVGPAPAPAHTPGPAPGRPAGSRLRSGSMQRNSSDDADAEVCRWLPAYSTCDVCASDVCLQCKACKHNKKSQACAPCWEGLLPCLPLCTLEKCW